MSPKSKPEEEEREDKIAFWLKWIERAKRKADQHWKDTKAAWAEYELASRSIDQDDTRPPRGYPIYKSSCEILEAAYYARTPKERIERRFGIDDDMALTMSLIGERLCQYLLQECHFDEGIIAARGDFIHGNKATTQIVYSTKTEPRRMPLQMVMGEDDSPIYYEQSPEQPFEGDVLSDDDGPYYEGEHEAIEESQQLFLAPCPFDEVLHTPEARTNAEITELAYKFRLPKKEAEEKFNPKGDRNLSYTELKSDDDSDEENDDKELVLDGWECYCLKTRTIYWVSESYKEDFLLVDKKDPYGFKGFFPSPPFIISSKPRKSMYPTSNFRYLEGTINQLHLLYEKIFHMIDGIRRRAVVLGASPELITALNSLGGNEYLTITEIDGILTKGGIRDMIQWIPVEELVNAISEAMNLEQHFKELFFEWFHVPDIIRGVSDPSETASAQEIKSDSALDVFKYQKKQIFELARNSLEMLFDLALKVFSDEKIAKICGYDFIPPGDPGSPGKPAVPPSPENPKGLPEEPPIPPRPGHKERFFEALTLLKDDSTRVIRLDFETDSTGFNDDAKEIARMRLISDTILQGLSTIGGIQNPQFTPVAYSLLLSMMDTVGGSKQFSDAVKKAVSDLEKAKDAPAPTPPPDPMIDIKRLDTEIKGQKVQADTAIKQQELQQKETKIMLDARDADFKNQIESIKTTMQNSMNEFLKWAETEKLKIEGMSATLGEREKMIEEQRLDVEQNLEQLRLLLQAHTELKGQEKPEAPELTINVHNPK